MKENSLNIGQRLSRCAEYIRDQAVLCDVGTDHAKLPIYLCDKERITRAYATDINQGPIQTARSNVSRCGYSDIIICMQADGLENTEGLGITDISICGMGGELIARILSDCRYVQDESINLVLQPMTHAHDLRKYLFDNGYSIIDESLVSEAGKLYTVINAVYSGTNTSYTELDLLLGFILPSREHDELFSEMCRRIIAQLEMRQSSRDQNEVEKAKRLCNDIKNVMFS